MRRKKSNTAVRHAFHRAVSGYISSSTSLQNEPTVVENINIQDHLFGKNEEPKGKNQSRVPWKVHISYLDGDYADIHIDLKKRMRDLRLNIL